MEFVKAPINISTDVGVSNSRRYINVSRQMCEVLGPSLARSLPGFHAMTGCDYNPAFHRKGKKRPLTILKNCVRYQEAFSELGGCSDRNDVFSTLEEFTCRLYNQKKINDVDTARTEIFMQTYKLKEHESTLKLNLSKYDACNLPPCRTELEQHLLRTKYISEVWSNAHKKCPTTSDPTNFGWSNNEGRLDFVWFTGNQLPGLADIVLDDEASTPTEEEDIDDSCDDLQSDVDEENDDEDESDSDSD